MAELNLSGISKAAFDLIVSEEVSSQATYTARYQRPEWPGGASGITIGIGYDCGYATADKIRSDWTARIPPEMVEALVRVAGVSGEAAHSRLAGIRPLVSVPWAAAIDVFANVDLPKWTATVRKALPNCDKLSPDCFGALVSLAYNRGPSFSNAGDRYAEMRSIKAHMAAQQFDKIPADFRSMKRLWASTSLRGVALRRDHEADMFQRGLSMKPLTSQPNITITTISKPAPPAPPSVTNPSPGSLGAFVAGIFAAIFKRKA
jgi:hypothetical protein